MYIGCSSSYANCVGLKAMNSKYSMQIPSGIPPAMHSEAFVAEFESFLNRICCWFFRITYRVFLLRQLWIVNCYVKSLSNNLSNEVIKTGVSRKIIFQT